MQKVRLNNILNIVLFFVMGVLLWLSFRRPIIFPFRSMWYIIVILFCTIQLYIKYILFKSDNVLWFAISLSLLLVYIVGYNAGDFSIKSWPFLVVIPCLSSTVLYIMHRNILHMGISTILNIISMPMFSFSWGMINVWWFILLEIISLFIGIIALKILIKFIKKGENYG